VALAASVSFPLVGCGLDANGLADMTDGSAEDGEVLAHDGSVPGADGSGSVDAGGGDATVPPGMDAGDDDAAADVTLPDASDSGGDDGAVPDGSPDAPADVTSPDAADGSGDDGAAGDAAPDSGNGDDDGGEVDAGPGDASVDACGSVEICNDGVDNDCNGRIDCDDPACTPGWTCTAAAVPSGWHVVEYTETTRPPCSGGYGNASPVLDGLNASPASCDCSCAITVPGSCTSGTFTAKAGSGAALGCNLLSNTYAADSGTCAGGPPYMPGVAGSVQVLPAPYTAGTCSADAGVTKGAVGSNEGRVCGVAEATGAGCASGGVCAPAASSGAVCIAQSGDVTCPSGYAHKYSVGAGIDDTRSCSGCSCKGTTGSCTGIKLSLFTDTKCGAAGEITLDVDGGCNPVGGPATATYHAYHYEADVTGESCSANAATPNGGVSLLDPQTVCCP
jgi:hypothetical protein